MFKFTAIFLMLYFRACLAENSDEIGQFDETERLEEGKEHNENTNFERHEFEESEELDENEEFDENAEFDENPKFNESQEFDFSATIEEDRAINRHVIYMDKAREALLQFAKDLRKGKPITNAFLKVIDGFEKQIANFQAALGRRTVDPTFVGKLKKFIEKASKDGKANTIILRKLIAQGLFLAQKTPSGIRSRAKRDAAQNAKRDDWAQEFLKDINSSIGQIAFNEFLSVDGLVTLIFAIDDTGSMGSHIKAAIAIATQIVQHKRDFDVDYILSPFNDPNTGPVTVKNETEGNEFVTALKSLYAHGGGDCPELAFKGMIDALTSGPQPGSSMYVFTDAAPKDATQANIDSVLSMAHVTDVTINFFLMGSICGNRDDTAKYNFVAKQTWGQIYSLKDNIELKDFGSLVSKCLKGCVLVNSKYTVPAGPGKRALSTSIYPISVDDSIEKILITVTTQNSGAGIILLDPKGKTITTGRILLAKGVVYEIANPVPGVYELTVPVSAGKHKYRVNAVSSTNIDFGHYYAYIPKRGRYGVPVPMEQPLQGISTTAFVTLAGAEFVESSSLTIAVVNDRSRIIYKKKLRSVGTSGVRYIVKFVPPSGPFKLELHGQTKSGNRFVRISAREDHAVPVILLLSNYMSRSTILPRGKRTRLTLQIRGGNVGKLVETYTVTMKDQRGYGKVLTQTRRVRRGRIGFAWIAFNVPRNAPEGKSESVEVFLTKEKETKPTATLRFSLLIV